MIDATFPRTLHATSWCADPMRSSLLYRGAYIPSLPSMILRICLSFPVGNTSRSDPSKAPSQSCVEPTDRVVGDRERKISLESPERWMMHTEPTSLHVQSADQTWARPFYTLTKSRDVMVMMESKVEQTRISQRSL